MELKNVTIKSIDQLKTFDSGFTCVDFVVTTDEQYPQTIPVEFTQDKTSLLNNFKIGDFVKIGINLRGTEWKGRYFANINGWKIDQSESSLTAQKQMPDREATQPINNAIPQAEEYDDGLPF